MSEQPVAFDRETRRRFVRVVRDFLTSEVRWRARGLLAILIAFALAVNGLNVVNSYVGRDFMTAIAHRDLTGFIQQAVLYIGVFAASTAVAVLYRFTEERLGLFWRVWLTQRITRRYLTDRTCLWLKESATVANPDQRIADDVRAFTTTTLSFTLMFLNGTLAILSFSGVLWTISPLLFGVAVGYAAIGTLTAIYLGRPLVGLNYRQSDQEANFRADLICRTQRGLSFIRSQPLLVVVGWGNTEQVRRDVVVLQAARRNEKRLLLPVPAEEHAGFEQDIVARHTELVCPHDGNVVRGKHEDAEVVSAHAIQKGVDAVTAGAENTLRPDRAVGIMVEVGLNRLGQALSFHGRSDKNTRLHWFSFGSHSLHLDSIWSAIKLCANLCHRKPVVVRRACNVMNLQGRVAAEILASGAYPVVRPGS